MVVERWYDASVSAPAQAPRARLIKAAEDHFRRFGYKGTTVDDITGEAATGKGSFYLHFDSKEQAYLAVVEASMERFLERAAEALRGEGTAPERLRALVAVTAEHYGDDEFLRSSMFGGGKLVDGEVARRAAEIQRGRIRGLLGETLAGGQSEGTIRAELDVDATAAILFEVGWAVVRTELEGASQISLGAALDALNDMIGLGLQPRETPGDVKPASRRRFLGRA